MPKPTIFLNLWLYEEREKACKFAIIGDCKTTFWLPKSMIITMHIEEDKSCSIEILEWQAISKNLI